MEDWVSRLPTAVTVLEDLCALTSMQAPLIAFYLFQVLTGDGRSLIE
ncbi:hypothetical protein AF72_01810 [Xylella taiwanensis]|uniref:Uncharacterized protein n=1 Tax=Xylella taiwanensis TaxID=1444770 RepID=Z9JLH3_9GAMM|nr:hypothetical protein AF72_01810 [Xylella taiwanensis]